MAVRDTRRGTSSCSVSHVLARQSYAAAAGSRQGSLPTAHSPLSLLPQLPIISKIRQDRVGSGRLKHWEQPSKEDVDQAICVPDIEVDGIERLPEMPFRVVVKRAAVEALVTVGDRP